MNFSNNQIRTWNWNWKVIWSGVLTVSHWREHALYGVLQAMLLGKKSMQISSFRRKKTLSLLDIDTLDVYVWPFNELYIMTMTKGKYTDGFLAWLWSKLLIGNTDWLRFLQNGGGGSLMKHLRMDVKSFYTIWIDFYFFLKVRDFAI